MKKQLWRATQQMLSQMPKMQLLITDGILFLIFFRSNGGELQKMLVGPTSCGASL